MYFFLKKRKFELTRRLKKVCVYFGGEEKEERRGKEEERRIEKRERGELRILPIRELNIRRAPASAS